MKEIVKSIIPTRFLSYFKKKYSNYLRASLKGTGVFCNICKSSYAKFAYYGNPKRENARCPTCDSLERHRLIFSFLEHKTSLFKETKNKLKLLHFAPEGFFYEAFNSSDSIEYVPCDLYPDIFDFDKKGIINKVDITQVPYEDNSFDYILCNHVLEHIPDDNKAISELYRVMKKDGLGIFQVPIDYNLDTTYEDFSITSKKGRTKAFGQKDHVRWYGKDYKSKLEKIGFRVIEDDYVNNFTLEEIYKLGFSSGELLYCCTK
jgi:SAM-dependent methyltransferase